MRGIALNQKKSQEMEKDRENGCNCMSTHAAPIENAFQINGLLLNDNCFDAILFRQIISTISCSWGSEAPDTLY